MIFRTLVDVLLHVGHVEDKGINFIEGSTQEHFVSYAALRKNAGNWLLKLRQSGLQEGDELVLQLDNNRLFVELFWACILGKIIPVPLQVVRNEETNLKLLNIWEYLHNPFLVTSAKNYTVLNTLNAGNAAAARVIDRAIRLDQLPDIAGEAAICSPRPGDIAFIQFSSGSTGTPKGVVLTHDNLLANIMAIHNGIHSPAAGDSFFSWMPLTHDMGLIGFHLTPLFAGWHHHIMPTDVFVRFPYLWLQKISQHRITFTASPNFGYRYVLTHFDKNSDEQLDLSSLRVIVNGAEPISYDVCVAFTEKMAKYKLRQNALFPVYGLAEASLAVTFSEVSEAPRAIYLDRNHLQEGQPVRITTPGDTSVALVNVGKPVKDTFVRLINSTGGAVGENCIGQIQISGRNVCAGYYNNAAASAALITPDGWLNTGDLGVVINGELYVTGRIKELFFVNGQNYYPYDIERIAEAADGVGLGKIVISGYHDADRQQEVVLAFIQYRGQDMERFSSIADNCKAHIYERTGILVHHFIPVSAIPKTTSGKVQRFKLTAGFQSGVYNEVLSSIAAAKATTGKTALNGAIEEELALLWKKALKITDIGAGDSFLELGGDSLTAVRLSALIEERFGVEIALTDILKYPTIAAFVKHNPLSGAVTAVKRIVQAAPQQAWYPLSSVQHRLYYQWHTDPLSTAYNVPVALTIKGELHIDRLQAALNSSVQRHEALRSAFEWIDGAPVCKIYPATGLPLEQLSATADTVAQVIRDLIKPFNLANAPLCRTALIQLNAQEHVLFLDFHHIVVDGISITLILDELFAAYYGRSRQGPAWQYKDFVEWERHGRTTAADSGQMAFWKNRLQGTIPVLQLSTDHERPAVRKNIGGRSSFNLPAGLVKGLKTLAAAEGVTMPLLLLAIYKLLLSKYAQQQDLVVGVPVSGRPHPAFHKTVGMFVNNIPIRTVVDPDQPFRSYLSELKDIYFGSLNNQDILFEDLVREFVTERSPDRNLLFDTMFIYQNMEMPEFSSAAVDVSRFEFDPGFSKYDLSIEFIPGKHDLQYSLEYATQLFTTAVINRLGANFRYLAEQVLVQPMSFIKDIQAVADQEKYTLIHSVNRTAATYPADAVLHGLFETQMKTAAGKTAVTQGPDQLTYGQLNQRANQLARALIIKGIRPQEPVCVYMHNSISLVTALLGILKAGGVFVPIDPAFPVNRKRFIYEDSGARLLLVNAEDAFSTNIPPEQVLDVEQGIPATLPDDDPGIHIPVSNLAYIIYTSGTTGTPKGVAIEHRNIVNYIRWCVHTYLNGQPSDFPLFTPITFDLTLTSIFVPLASGNTIHVYNGADPGAALEQIVHDNKVAVIKLTPAHLRLLNALAIDTNPAQSRIRVFVAGGEALNTSLAGEIAAKFHPQTAIFNEYGPTETAVGCIVHRFNKLADDGDAVPIGTPIANTQVYILDAQRRIIPHGATGELYISGNGVGRGYWRRDDLTKNAFFDNPFVPGERIYRTGDLARFKDDLTIEYKGRKDRQVKIRGYRIELEEIEGQLNSHPAIKEAVVLVNNNAIHAYYVSATAVNETALESYLRDSLPAYMVPAIWVPLDAMPLTLNGKIDQALLPACKTNKQPPADAVPESQLELDLQRIFEKVLDHAPISVNDDFYAVGGDSIKAVQISAALRAAGMELKANSILIYRTIKKISASVKWLLDAPDSEISPVTGKKAFSPVEEWFFGLQLTAPAFYNQSVLLQLKRKINKDLLEKALQTIIRYHDGLRLNYDLEAGSSFYNDQHLTHDLTLSVVDISHLAPQEQQPALIEAGHTLKSQFNLETDLLFKAVLIQCAETDLKLLCTAHHLVIDGISWRILLDDLYTVYDQLEKNTAVILPAKTAPLTRWRQALQDNSRLFLQQQDFWNSINNTLFTLPAAHNGGWQDSNRHTRTISLDKEQTQVLVTKASQRYKADASIIITLALVKSLTDWTTGAHCVIELEGHGRGLPEIDVSRTVGWFTAMYPVRLTLARQELSKQIIEIKEQLRAVPSQGIGYGVLKYMYKAFTGLTDNPPEVRFNYLGALSEFNNDLFNYEWADTGADSSPANRLSAKLDIVAMIVQGVLRIDIQYPAGVFHPGDIGQFEDNFRQHLLTVIQHLDSGNEVSLSPSDFKSAALDNEDIAQLFSN